MTLIAACSNKVDVAKYVKQQIGKTIVIEKTHYENSDIFLLDSLFENSLFLILMTPHEKVCASCYFASLKEVNSLINACNTDKVNCVVFAHESYDEFLDLKDKLEANHFFIINDYDNSYTIDNKLVRYVAEYRTFLVDNERKIRLVGSPVVNESVANLYIKEIKNTIQH